MCSLLSKAALDRRAEGAVAHHENDAAGGKGKRRRRKREEREREGEREEEVEEWKCQGGKEKGRGKKY